MIAVVMLDTKGFESKAKPRREQREKLNIIY